MHGKLRIKHTDESVLVNMAEMGGLVLCLGMCDILKSRDTSTNFWKYELWEANWNSWLPFMTSFCKNILEIFHLYSRMTVPHAILSNCLEKWKWIWLSWLAITVTRHKYYSKIRLRKSLTAIRSSEDLKIQV